MPFAPAADLIAAIAAGHMVVLVDDEDRENEGDLIMAAECADDAAVAFMATKGCGLICLAMEGDMLDRLGLPLMTRNNRSRLGTAFTLSIEAADGVTTGISAADRVTTIQAAIADDSKPQDVVSPGHVFPVRAVDGGVLVRAGHSEASVDLARLAGRKPAAVICEIMKPDGTMARLPDLETYCTEHNLLLGCIADLIAYREQSERVVELSAEASIMTPVGPARAYSYRSRVNNEHHLAVVFGDAVQPGHEQTEPVLVRVQQEHVLDDVFGCEPLGDRLRLTDVLGQISQHGSGVLLYIRDSDGGRMPAVLKSYGGTTHGTDPSPRLVMDPRLYGTGAQILRELGIRRMRLLTASDQHLSALSGYGLEIVERVAPVAAAAGAND